MSLRELIKDKWIPFLDDEVDLEELAANHLSADAPSDGPANWVQIVQSAHRLRLIESWLRRDDGAIDIASLCDRVLEAGCGQGDQTAALAAIMRKYPGLQQSVIHGVDPGPPDYGAPFTLKQAQSYLAEGALKDYIVFEARGNVSQTLTRHPQFGYFTTIVFSHCLWYFGSTNEVLEAFKAAQKHGVKYMLLAEWSLRAGNMSAVPHVLAALLQSHAPVPEGNIRLLLSPDAIKSLAEQAGWTMDREDIVTPQPELQDGRWEVGMAVDQATKVLQSQDGNEIHDAAVEPYLYALKQSIPSNQNEITCMDVWTAVFVRPDFVSNSTVSK